MNNDEDIVMNFLVSEIQDLKKEIKELKSENTKLLETNHFYENFMAGYR